MGEPVNEGETAALCDAEPVGVGECEGDAPADSVALGELVVDVVGLGVSVSDAVAVPVPVKLPVGVPLTYSGLKGASATPRYTEAVAAVAIKSVVPATVSYAYSVRAVTAYSTNAPDEPRAPVME